jgi:aminoglycoside 2''-phosphotransferase
MVKTRYTKGMKLTKTTRVTEVAQLITDRAALEGIIRQYEPSVQEISYIDHGHDNLVVVVNNKLVFRFPRNDVAARRLEFEIALLQLVKGKITAVPTPDLLEVSTTPLYAVMAYREGMHLTQTEIEALTDDEQTMIGRKLAEFMVQFSNAISGEQLMRLRKEAGLIGIEESWPEYFDRLFRRMPLPNERLAPIVDEYYGTWKNYIQAEQGRYAIHDDLHPANILFTGPSVSAVLDFGDANVGTAEEEMRGLFRMGDQVLQATIDRFHELTGRSIQYEHIRIWGIMNDLARFVRYLGEQRTTHPAFLRAQTNLREWIPNFPL